MNCVVGWWRKLLLVCLWSWILSLMLVNLVGFIGNVRWIVWWSCIIIWVLFGMINLVVCVCNCEILSCLMCFMWCLLVWSGNLVLLWCWMWVCIFSF